MHLLDQTRRLSIPRKPYIVNKLAHCNTIERLALCVHKLLAFQ